MSLNRPLPLVAVLLTSAMLIGCAAGQTRNATSVVDYLYPDTKDPVVEPGIPVLTLPLRVGIAFVPGERTEGHSGGFYASGASAALTEKQKVELMQEVADHFRKYEFVKSIELIPSAYLTPQGGFANLKQIQTMYGVDVIALLSYDQVQFTDEGVLSLTYWTIVGAYVVPGEKNSTHTMLDAVVFDISSRKMLFRAPGISHIEGAATPVNLSEELRKDRGKGFDEASVNMVANLDEQLALFREKVKEQPDQYQVVHSSGYSGGGSLDWVMLALLAGLTLWARRLK